MDEMSHKSSVTPSRPMEPAASVLISGASVAGPALAFWLWRRGFTPTIVERAPHPRPGGQAIDIRGAAMEVVARMGILPEIRRMRTRITGMSMLDRNGNELRRSTERSLTAGRFDSGDLEIMRDDLSAILTRPIERYVEYLFGDSIAQLSEDGGSVHVDFEHGRPRRFGLVIGADGIYSRTRTLAFGSSHAFIHFLGSYLAVFTVENFLGLENWQVGMWGEKAGMLFFPARDNSELRIFVLFTSEPLDRDLDLARQKALVVERCAELGWEAPRALKKIEDARDFYFSPMAQVRMPRWSSGRVALVGDAAYCPSPKSGQGTSLALVGAYVLAEELARARDDFSSAFSSYEARMRRYVTLNQALAIRGNQDEISDDALNAAKNGIELDGKA